MKTLHLSIIICLIIFGSSIPAWASVELNAYLPISGDPVTPQYKFSKLVTITYPLGGKLKSLLEGQNKTVSFTEDSASNPSVKKLMDDINAQLATSTNAITTITDLQLNYQTRVTGGSFDTYIEYSIALIPTLTNYVLNKGQGDIPTSLDASWMTFNEEGPVIITTQKYGDLEINYLVSFIKSQLPDVYDVIKGTGGETALEQNLIDSRPLLNATPLDRWDSLFDPSYTLTQTAPREQIGDKVAVTTYAAGLSGFGGEQSTRIGGAEFGTDSDYHLDITQEQNAGTVNVEGHASPYNMQGKWAFATTLNNMSASPCGACPAVLWYERTSAIWIWVGIIAAGIAFGIFYFKHFR